MRFERFRELAAAYGARLDLWPAETRRAARQIAETAEGAAVLAPERLLDDALAADAAEPPGEGVKRRALERLRGLARRPPGPAARRGP